MSPEHLICLATSSSFSRNFHRAVTCFGKFRTPTIRHDLASQRLILSWPTNQPGFLLEGNSLSFQPLDWQPLSTDVWNGRNVVTNSLDQPGRVFRLKKETPAP